MARDYSKFDAYLDARERGASVEEQAEILGVKNLKSWRVVASTFATVCTLAGLTKRGACGNASFIRPDVRAKAIATRKANAAAYKAWKDAGCPGLPTAAE